jgi:hypothetical protein
MRAGSRCRIEIRTKTLLIVIAFVSISLMMMPKLSFAAYCPGDGPCFKNEKEYAKKVAKHKDDPVPPGGYADQEEANKAKKDFPGLFKDDNHNSKKHHNDDNKGSLTSKSKGSLQHIASVATDFPNDDPNTVEVHVTSAKEDSIGAYHVRGEIKNLSNDTLSNVKVTGHFSNTSGQPVAVTTCCYTTPTDIDPGHTSTFDSFSQKDELSGTPTSYRLSFDWR